MITSHHRCLLVWVVATAVALATCWWSLSTTPPTAIAFATWVDRGAAWVLSAAAVWAWLVTSLVLGGEVVAARRGRAVTVRGVPSWARRAVLGACGVVLMSTSPALADGTDHQAPSRSTQDPQVLVGLALPDRTTGAEPGRVHSLPTSWTAASARSAVAVASSGVVVGPGDCLWGIAADLLPRAATPAEVAELTARLHDLNRDVIGGDPDLILPGQHLRTSAL